MFTYKCMACGRDETPWSVPGPKGRVNLCEPCYLEFKSGNKNIENFIKSKQEHKE